MKTVIMLSLVMAFLSACSHTRFDAATNSNGRGGAHFSGDVLKF